MAFIQNNTFTFSSELGVSLKSINSTSTNFILKSLTAGSGVTLTSGDKTITIAASGGGGGVTSVNNTSLADVPLVVGGGTATPTVKGISTQAVTGSLVVTSDANNVIVNVRTDNSVYTPITAISVPGGSSDPTIFYTGDGSRVESVNGPGAQFKCFSAVDPIFIANSTDFSSLQIHTTLTSVKSSEGPGISSLAAKTEFKNNREIPYTSVKTLLGNEEGITVIDNDDHIKFSNTIQSSGGMYSLVGNASGYSKIKGIDSNTLDVTDKGDSLQLEYLLQSIGNFTSLTKNGKIKSIRFGGTLRVEEYDDHIFITNQ